MFSDWEVGSEVNDRALSSLYKSLKILAKRSEAPEIRRSWNSEIRISLLRKLKSDIPEGTIIDCLADTIKYDVMMPDYLLYCKFRPGAHISACKLARIGQETKIYLQLHGVNTDQYECEIESALLLLLEKQAKKPTARTVGIRAESRTRNVVVEYLENSAPTNINYKTVHQRSLLKTNQSLVIRAMKTGHTTSRISNLRGKTRLDFRFIN